MAGRWSPRRWAPLLVAALLLPVGCVGDPVGAAAQPGPPSPINPDSVGRALAELDRIVSDDLAATTVPGAAVAVVYRGEVRYAKGFGVREVGKPDPVGTATVFQLASVSKSISSTVVARAVERGALAWTDAIAAHRPGFTLADPWVGEHVTIADMFAHRSGLPDHSGDVLEDLGYSQDEIIARQRFLPLDPFRDSYHYTNYGLTIGGGAVAAAAGTDWATLADREVFGPLGMTAASFRYADLQARPDRAALHRREGAAWVPVLDFDVDRQAPAGGASASVDDLTKWITMLLADDGLSAEQRTTIWAPQSVRQPAQDVGDRTGFYGLGWNIDYDAAGRLTVQHSGAFGTGAATNVLLIPAEDLGIVTLTNGSPEGLPEAINARFVDQVEHGAQTRDWLALYQQAFATLEPSPDPTDYSAPPPAPAPAGPLPGYVGTYHSDYWGDAVVRDTGTGLEMLIGPDPTPYPLTHYTADTFSFATRGESNVGRTGAVFAGPKLTITGWDAPPGVGVFTRTG